LFWKNLFLLTFIELFFYSKGENTIHFLKMDIQDKTDIIVDEKSLKYLNTARRWAMFLAVTGFIFLGIMIIAGALAGTFLSIFDAYKQFEEGMPGWIIFGSFVAIALFYFFPVFYLFRFAKHAGITVETQNSNDLRIALRNLRSFFICTGILLIVILALYFAALIITGSSVAFSKTFS
jgi:hypothetical protein